MTHSTQTSSSRHAPRNAAARRKAGLTTTKPLREPLAAHDRWHGVGGEYVVENGVRRRVDLPQDAPDAAEAATETPTQDTTGAL